MILLDTGYLIALFDVRDALHARAVAWAKVVEEPVLVTEYVAWECVNYFSVSSRCACPCASRTAAIGRV